MSTSGCGSWRATSPRAEILGAGSTPLDREEPARAPKPARRRFAPRWFEDEVKAVVVRRMSGERPSVETVARDLGFSPRSLQRHLAKLGGSYQRILDDVRHETALRLLQAHELGMSEISFLLGFGEVNSFTRAFRGWEGTTPIRWRARGAI